MIQCTEVEFVTWQPDFSSSGQESGPVTRMLSSGDEIVNAVELVDWSDPDGPQVQVCEACGIPGCKNHGYACISRIGEHLMWTRRKYDRRDEVEVARFGPCSFILKRGAALIADADWARWHRDLDGLLPAPDIFPAARRIDVVDAWMLGAYWQPQVLEMLSSEIGDHFVAADPGSMNQALAVVHAVIDWAEADPSATFDGDLTAASGLEWEVVTFYSEQPDWAVFARRRDEVALCLDAEWIVPLAGLTSA